MENRRELTKSSANCNRGGPNSITNYTYLLCPPCRLQSAITSLIFTLTFGIGPTTNFINLIRVILQISDCITSSVHLRGFINLSLQRSHHSHSHHTHAHREYRPVGLTVFPAIKSESLTDTVAGYHALTSLAIVANYCHAKLGQVHLIPRHPRSHPPNHYVYIHIADNDHPLLSINTAWTITQDILAHQKYIRQPTSRQAFKGP